MRNLIGRTCASAMLLAMIAAPAHAQTGNAQTGNAQTGDAAKGRALFQAQCGVCHSVTTGKTLVGPSLAGIVGRVAGKQAGFAYSPAMAKAGFKWDRAKLDAWMASPARVVPGNRMPFAGVADGAKRADLLAYLAGAR